MKKFRLILLVVLAIIFIGIAIYYWVTPAGSLQHFFPGYEARSKTIHIKHGIAAIILALGCGVLAWFSSGDKPTSTTDTTKN
jgi:hypothetical protein